MDRGEIWWAHIDERRAVVLLSRQGASQFRAMQIVAPAGVDITGVAIEVNVGVVQGLAHEGVLRVALPEPGRVLCSWLVTLTRDDLIEHAGALTPPQLRHLEQALHLAELDDYLR